MKEFSILTVVFLTFLGVDSLVELKNTIPQNNMFPALILKRIVFADPAVPSEIVTEKDGTKKLKFESFDKKLKMFENLSLSYACQMKGSEELAYSKTPQCENELRVQSYSTGDTCGKDKNKKKHNIGYGLVKKTDILSIFKNSKKTEMKVEFPLYASCFDEKKGRADHVEYMLMSRNQLYSISNEIYPEMRDEISKLHIKFLKGMAVKFGVSPDNVHLDYSKSTTNELIPFQLVSHEDMILYNWKLATFNEMNYNLIWSKVANNTWRKINLKLRDVMKKSNFDLDIYTGVHDYSEDGYPRYLWKFIHRYLEGIVVVVHNHPGDDTDDYNILCDDNDGTNDSDVYGFAPDERDKSMGRTYCCSTKTLKDKIPFFKKNFREIDTLKLPDLFSVDDEFHPEKKIQPVRDVASASSSSSKPNLPDDEPFNQYGFSPVINPEEKAAASTLSSSSQLNLPDTQYLNPYSATPYMIRPRRVQIPNLSNSNTSKDKENQGNSKQSVPNSSYEIKQSDVDSLQKKLEFDRPPGIKVR